MAVDAVIAGREAARTAAVEVLHQDIGDSYASRRC